MLSPEQCVGSVDVSLLPSRNAGIKEEERIALAREQSPLVAVVNLHDFEVSTLCVYGIPRQTIVQAAASKILPGSAWAFYSSVAEEGASEWVNAPPSSYSHSLRPR
jgi:hypothetical protein